MKHTLRHLTAPHTVTYFAFLPIAAASLLACAVESSPDAETGGDGGSTTGGGGAGGSAIDATGGMAGSAGSSQGGASGGASGASGASAGASGGSAGASGSAGGSGAGGSGAGGASGSAGEGGEGGSGEGGSAGEMAGAGGEGGAMGGEGGETTGGAGGDENGGAGGDGMEEVGGMDGGDSTMSSGCGTEPTIPSNMYNNGSQISISAGGMNRRYILRVPDDYDNTKPYKLIIAWHQLDGNDVQMYANDYYHLFPLSGGNAIFAAPNGQKNGSPCTTTGNGDGGCGWPNSGGADVALGDAVVEELKANFCIDTQRIFATGWSYGGSMSYKHACERGLGGTKDGVEGYVRAIAAYSGAQLSGQCTPTTPVAYYGSHGTQDNVLGYNGGVGLAQNFANINGCSWATPPEATGNHICTDISGCDEGYPVKFCSFNGPHTPDPSDGGGGSWQYQLVWDFFDQF